MTNLAQRDQKLQKLVNDTIRAREQRDDALTKLVKAETKLRTLEKQQERFRKSTKAIRKRLLIEATTTPAPKLKPVAATPKPKPEPAPKPEPTPVTPAPVATPPTDPAAKAAALRGELRGDRKKRN